MKPPQKSSPAGFATVRPTAIRPPNSPRQPVAPPVYRPEPQRVAQPKPAVPPQPSRPAQPPPAYRPFLKRVVQPKAGVIPLSSIIQRALPSPMCGGVIQCIPVDHTDINQRFEVVTKGGTQCYAELIAIRGGGWFDFKKDDGTPFKVHGQSNIIKRAPAAAAIAAAANPYAAAVNLPANTRYFDLDALATAQNVPRAAVYKAVREQFKVDPASYRIRSQFGTTTVAKGRFLAYSDINESVLSEQAMVSHRKADFGYDGEKIGGDYADWAEELTDQSGEDEDMNVARAVNMTDYLTNPAANMDAALFNERQRASAASLLSASQISEPLRTDASTDRAAQRGTAALNAIAVGVLGFSQSFAFKKKARYYPARSGGASRERNYYTGAMPGTPNEVDLDDYL